MPNEADTGRKWKFVVPKLQPAGWANKPHSIAEKDHSLYLWK